MTDPMQLQRDVRAVLLAADGMSREEHARAADESAQVLAALRTFLVHVDLELGANRALDEACVAELHALAAKARSLVGARVVDGLGRAAVERLLADVHNVEAGLRRAILEPRRRVFVRRVAVAAAAGVSLAVVVVALAGALRPRRTG